MENQVIKTSITSALVAFFVALPRLVELCLLVGRALQKRGAGEWLTKLEKTTDNLEKARTKDEKIQSAKDIAAVISTL